jgi:2-dehydropantoate 2-reductase
VSAAAYVADAYIVRAIALIPTDRDGRQPYTCYSLLELVRENIRWNVWLKLWGNVCFNPISLLTHSTLDRITSRQELRAICERIMLEAKAVADAVGVVIPLDMIARRLAAAGKVIGHKMSMLQDLERKRSLELDALVTAVQEIARLVGVETPMIDVVSALARERGLQAGLYAQR